MFFFFVTLALEQWMLCSLALEACHAIKSPWRLYRGIISDSHPIYLKEVSVELIYPSSLVWVRVEENLLNCMQQDFWCQDNHCLSGKFPNNYRGRGGKRGMPSCTELLEVPNNFHIHYFTFDYLTISIYNMVILLLLAFCCGRNT